MMTEWEAERWNKRSEIPGWVKHAEGRNHSNSMWHKDERGRDLSAAVVSPCERREVQASTRVSVFVHLSHSLLCFTLCCMDAAKYFLLYGSTRYSAVNSLTSDKWHPQILHLPVLREGEGFSMNMRCGGWFKNALHLVAARRGREVSRRNRGKWWG